ncbi:outer membrane protein [Bullifex porci]|uniref:outer membrane protein n=1 Tax=Bullifex porci TaxID=2606638 RepID=UPI0023F498ED|nr:outer membrane beta-barrel protein [Bullifex porci]MDD7255680.1 hypothetical protein [Bullifex porci]MDY2742161.1 hypothetical protein [Bullifex porci]
MKKVLALVALLVMTVSVVFAGSVYLDSGVSFTKGNSNLKFEGSNEDTKLDFSVLSLPLEAGYRQTFGNGVVVSGSAGVFFNLNENFAGNSSGNEKLFPTQFSFKAQAGYGLKINEKLSAEFLGGLSYAFGKKSYNNTYTLTYNTFSIVGEAGIKYNVASSIILRAGAKMSIPFTTFGKQKMTGLPSVDFKVSGFVFNITPFVGVAYQF